MSSFEFVFSLFGFVLGLTLVEVLSGFVRSTKIVRTRSATDAVRMGWFTPMLAVFVLLDVTSYWQNMWAMRAVVPVGLDTMFIGLAISGTYYYAASMVFPDDAQAWPDLDAWFWLHKRYVVGPLFIVNLVWVSTWSLSAGLGSLDFFVTQGLYFLLLGIVFLERRRTPVATALGLSIFLYLFAASMHLAAHLGWIVLPGDQ